MVTTFPPLPGESRWPHVGQWTWEHWRHWLMTAGWSAEQALAFGQERWNHGVVVPDRKTDKPRPLYLPTPRQLEASKCVAPNLLYGGAAGGAKSHWLRWDFYRRALSCRNWYGVILRRTMPELERTHIKEAMREAEIFGAKFVDGEVRFPQTQSVLSFGHCQDEKMVGRYLSAEFDAIGADEAATFPGEWLLEIMSRARSTKEGVQPIVRLTSNPGGAHTLWLVDRFITKTVDAEVDPTYDAAEHAYIPAKLFDNPYLMDPDGTFTTYVKRLGPLSPERRRQLLEGDWSAIGGQFFPEFNRQRMEAVIDAPEWCQWERWIDWGYNAPGVCYWVAMLPDGRLYVRHEYKFTQTIAQEVARSITRQTSDLARMVNGGKPLSVRKTVADPSMWNKTGHSGESMAETFARNRVPMLRGDNDRVLGWQRLRHWFSDAPDGKPWLLVHPSCAYAWRSIPSLIGDKTNPEDVDTEGEDHCADSWRYGVMSRPAPSRSQTGPKSYPKGSGGDLMAQLNRGRESVLGAGNVRGAA